MNSQCHLHRLCAPCTNLGSLLPTPGEALHPIPRTPQTPTLLGGPALPQPAFQVDFETGLFHFGADLMIPVDSDDRFGVSPAVTSGVRHTTQHVQLTC